jgi:asparagine synthase (glutamine-hydrolysing)
MFSDDRDTVLVFNGEIYNHAELRRELEDAGHRFFSKCDTEVVLRAYIEWDKEFLSRLRGMFAIALWTESKKRLLLARDRLGIKPLYLHQRGKDLYFGSELKALFAHSEVPRNLDSIALEYFLSLNYVPCPHTLVEGITKLPPGHLLEWRDGHVNTEPYWQLKFDPGTHRSIEDAQEKLDVLLRESVREHLLSDVPLGIWLSGGLDSSTILHYASEASSSRLKTFSISFRGHSFDETQYIREVAARYGTDHHELDLNPDQDLEVAVGELAYYSDEPSADAGALPLWFLARMTRQHAVVALSGEGADELFGGYLTYAADRLARPARRVPQPFRRGLLSLLRHWPVSDDKIGLEYKVKRFLEGTLQPPDEAHTYWNGTFTPAQQRQFMLRRNGGAVGNLFERDLPQAGSATGLNRYLAFDQRYYLPDDILYKVDRMSMAHAVEVRTPFLDHRIAEFAASLPEDFKIQGRVQKLLLRRLMKGKLPKSVLRRPKIGLDIPVHGWLRGPLRSLLLDTLSRDALERSNLFRTDQVLFLIDQHLERRANIGFHLWGMLILFLWMQRWKIQPPPLAEAVGESLASVSTLT